ncbi:MAG: pyridoxamine 5'-phosphate oxidase family protein [Anaerolineae bacterium]|nr:pyridoxamine 5'-phosphate oxidase family protein [Anaerolineae bacterium]
MPKDYLNQERTAIRRNDRAVEDDAWIKQFLHQAAVGTLATVHEGQPFVNTNLFVYDEDTHSIIMHTAHVGRTVANLGSASSVCFSIMEMGRLLPAPEALEFSVEYAGVTIFGKAEIVDDEAQATQLLQLLLDKYAPHLHAGDDYRPPVPEELKRTAVFRIRIEEWSAKKKEVGEHPGAFWFAQNPILQSVREREAWQGTLRGIFITPDVGGTVEEHQEIEAIAGHGLVGDRHNSASTPSMAGITLFSLEDVQAVNDEYNIPLQPIQMRRNLLTTGVPLNHLVGKRFRVGDVVIQGVELCEPCNSLAQYTGYGAPLISALLHRGGLRGEIIQGGIIRAGDVITPLDAEA